MRSRWIIGLASAALVAASCGAPSPEFDGEGGAESPFAEELERRIAFDLTVDGDGTVERDRDDVRPGRPVTLTAIPGVGQHFVRWTGDLTGSENPIEIRPETDVTATAVFEPIPPVGPELTITISPPEGGFVSRRSGPIAEGDINLRAVPANGWRFVGWDGMVTAPRNPIFLPMTRDSEITAIFERVDQAAPVINLWGGDLHRFELGVPQRWLNIRGNVSDPDGVASLTYSLDDGPEQALSIGADGRRLQDPGDFNIEIDTDTLTLGRHRVVVRARDGAGNVGEVTTTVEFTGNEWPLPYQTNWAAAGAVEDQAQIVDGLWSVGADGIRNEQSGYDRLVAIGDDEWTDYEATFTLTIHEADNRGYDLTSEPFVGLIMRWPGHSLDEDNVEPPQPRWFYWPAGSLSGYYLSLDGSGQVRIEGNRSISFDADDDVMLEMGVEYAVRAAVESGPAGVVHRIKVWPADDPEPRSWSAEITELLADAGPEGGSLLLITHYFDVTFGDITVVPIVDGVPLAVDDGTVTDASDTDTEG